MIYFFFKLKNGHGKEKITIMIVSKYTETKFLEFNFLFQIAI